MRVISSPVPVIAALKARGAPCRASASRQMSSSCSRLVSSISSTNSTWKRWSIWVRSSREVGELEARNGRVGHRDRLLAGGVEISARRLEVGDLERRDRQPILTKPAEHASEPFDQALARTAAERHLLAEPHDARILR